ncbi:GvpL/GvpF family gas vesicle protein [Micromonospora zhanjiangensis]|uniref:GvpL/GvpF family gas vesicle protein n=1 Tax=Micromonospora zhanjiangensis TaxID=1522057 RepID=A0ABV8KJZ4_9ACTN
MTVESAPIDAPEKTARETGWLVYGVVPGDVEVVDEARGAGDPPAPVRVVQHRDLGALVSEVRLDRPLGRPDDLRAYKELLDGTTLAAPVLPVRFGTVLTEPAAVAELLDAEHDAYLAELTDLTDRLQYVVRARYRERELLTDVLAGNAEAARLREQLADLPEEASRDLRIRLGEVIATEVEARRQADTGRLVAELSPVSVEVADREPTHEEDAAHVAFLVAADRTTDFEGVVERLAADWADRATVRLLGPMAAYDFVGRIGRE